MRAAVLVIFVAAGALLLARCSTPALTLRCRMSLAVDTPAGTKAGSSVMELVLQRKFLIPMPGAGGGDRGGGFELFGEAPFVDLGNGQSLFVKWNGNDYRTSLKDAVLDGIRLYERRKLVSGDSDERIFRNLNKTKPTELVRPDRYPMLATFADTTNARSVDEASPDNLGRLGPGYAIKSINVEIVDAREPLTRTLAARYPDLAKIRGLVTLNSGGAGQHY